MSTKKGSGEVRAAILNLLRKRAQTSEELAIETGFNRQYILKTLRELAVEGKVLKTGVASPGVGCVFKLNRSRK